MSTFIFSKTQEEKAVFKAEFSQPIIAADILSINPNADSISVSLSPEGTDLYINVENGVNGITYGIQAAVQFESGDVDSATFAISVSEQNVLPYKTSAPDQYMDLVGRIQAGQSAVASAVFTLPGYNLKNGYVDWDLIDANNDILASGNAFECIIKNNGLSNTLIARCVITCPSTVDPTLIDSKYQLRYTLHVEDQEFYQFENLTVDSNVTIPVGTPDVVELQGTRARLSLVTTQPYQYVKCTVYQDNTALCSTQINQGTRVASGWLYSADVDTANMPVSLENYTVVFSYGNNGVNEYQESSKLWVINASIQTACGDILARVNKARTTLYGSPDLLYPIPTILLWMRRGMDRFNGSYGIFTTFTMTNAKGGIREYWLMWTELMAIRAQYLAEGEKAFDYSGAAISLNVDRTGYLESAASAIQSELDNEFKPFKQNLVNKGQTGGDGSGDVSQSAPGALGAVGISLTPTNGYGQFYPWYYSGFAGRWR